MAIITAVHENGELKVIRRDSAEVERTINLLRECGYRAEIEAVDCEWCVQLVYHTAAVCARPDPQNNALVI